MSNNWSPDRFSKAWNFATQYHHGKFLTDDLVLNFNVAIDVNSSNRLILLLYFRGDDSEDRYR
jgi:hypothetical protein